MAAFCIPKQLSQNLKEAAVRGEINIKALYEMNSQERRGVFAKYTNEDTAQHINAGFEKAMVSNQQTALKKWAEQTFDSQGKKTRQYKDVVAKINDLQEEGILSETAKDNFLYDLVATRLGATISPDEVAEINKRSAKMQAAFDAGKSEFGTPTIEYFKAKQEMEKYLDSITPSSRLKIASSTIGRGTMLTSVKSPLVNIVGNTVQGILSGFERRLASGRVSGVNSDYAMSYVRFVHEVYQKSGYDISRMLTLGGVQQTLGEERVHSEGPGKVRAIGRLYEDIVFKQLMGAPDVAFSAVHFADSANIATSKIAAREGLSGAAAKARALTIFKDATSITPQTIEGEAVRAQAIADAQYATFTNDSYYSTVALSIRKVFNTASGDLRLGDQIMPFVKTPANVIGVGLDMSGLSALRAAYNIKGALQAAKEGDRGPMNQVARDFIRSGLGLTLAVIISSLFKPDDFIGEYPKDPKEQALLQLKNATPNSVKIGGKWVSLDYFGGIAAPLVGILYARKYGTSLPDMVYKYAQGVIIQSTKIPGLSTFYDTIDAMKAAQPEQGASLSENAAGVANSAIDFIRARVIPGIVSDIARATDTFERKTDVKRDPFAKVKASVPGVRETLPVDKNALVEDRKTEPGWSAILFGSRVKTAQDNDLIRELSRLDKAGQLPSITDISKTSTRVKELRAQIGEARFERAMAFYGNTLRGRLRNLISSPTYKQMDADTKKKYIERIKTGAVDNMLGAYGYRKPIFDD